MNRFACSGAKIPLLVPVGFTAFGPDVTPNNAVALCPSDVAGLTLLSASLAVKLPTPPDPVAPSELSVAAAAPAAPG